MWLKFLLVVLVCPGVAWCEWPQGAERASSDFERSLVVDLCRSQSEIPGALLRQSWTYDPNRPRMDVAFGETGFAEYGSLVNAAYCIEGRTIVARFWIDIGGHARELPRLVPVTRIKIEQLDEEKLVLRYEVSGEQVVLYRMKR